MGDRDSASKIGMMQGAYFVGRVELLKWINDFLQLNYKKVEDVSNGAAFCQLMDYIYPNKIPLHRVNFDAKLEWESEKNWKILQGAFEKLKIDKVIMVDRLIKGRYQDNLEFFQWMRAFFDRMAPPGGEYDAVYRRESAKQRNKVIRGPTAASSAPTDPAATHDAAPTRQPAPRAPRAAPGASSAEVARLKEEVGQLNVAVSGLEHERDFYFGKLRQIELYLQEEGTDAQPTTAIIEHVMGVLYAPDEEE